MAEPQFHLAQVNIARMMAPLDSPMMADFMAQLDEINALADGSAGFVWRFQGEAGNATYLRPYADERIIFNMSVWESVETLRAYVYRSAHASAMRRRKDWFEKFDDAYMALWWLPAGHRPSVAEAKARLEHLQQRGPTARAFTMKEMFAPDGVYGITSV